MLRYLKYRLRVALLVFSNAGSTVRVLLSIFIATFNRQQYIRDRLIGVVVQEFGQGFEILVGKECSSDETSGVIAAVAKEFLGQSRTSTD